MNRPLSLASALVVVLAAGVARAGAPDDLRTAASEGRPVFLVVTEAAARGTDLARRVSADAAKIVPGATVVELDRGDPANAAVVKRYRLASAPVPLILVVASNGVAAGGAKPGGITAAKLARLVPSAGKAGYLQALDQGKAALLVFGGETTPGRAAAVGACAEATKTLEGKALTVVIDPADPREAEFVAEMSVDPKALVAVTVVVNAKGQRAAGFDAVPPAAALVEAATKPVEDCGCVGGRCK
jgi:hypothetical protein